MNFRNWIWVYLATGESFTRWAVLLFHGVIWGTVITVLILLGTLALSMALR